jgi:hypothetical protein
LEDILSIGHRKFHPEAQHPVLLPVSLPVWDENVRSPVLRKNGSLPGYEIGTNFLETFIL